MDPQTIIPEDELHFSFIQSSGPGGQNINKVATAVQLRFCVDLSRAINLEQKERLKHLAGRRMSAGGWLTIEAKRYRSQEKNKADAITRLEALIVKARILPKSRRPTKPTNSSVHKRIETKKRKAFTKKYREKVFTEPD